MTAYTARAFSTNLLQDIISQTAHGFIVGNIIRYTGSTYVLANANTFLTSQSVGMVSSVINANTFVVSQAGYITGLPLTIVEGGPLVAGNLYYLSAIFDGMLSITEPVLTGQTVVDCFIADSNSSGFFFNNAGRVNKPITHFDWVEATASGPMDINTGYLVNGGASIDLTLPSVANVGDMIRIATLGTNGVHILQNAGQSINFVDVDTTVGVLGELDLLATNGVLAGALEIICTVQDVNFKVISGNGNWDVI